MCCIQETTATTTTTTCNRWRQEGEKKLFQKEERIKDSFSAISLPPYGVWKKILFRLQRGGTWRNCIFVEDRQFFEAFVLPNERNFYIFCAQAYAGGLTKLPFPDSVFQGFKSKYVDISISFSASFKNAQLVTEYFTSMNRLQILLNNVFCHANGIFSFVCSKIFFQWCPKIGIVPRNNRHIQMDSDSLADNEIPDKPIRWNDRGKELVGKNIFKKSI